MNDELEQTILAVFGISNQDYKKLHVMLYQMVEDLRFNDVILLEIMKNKALTQSERYVLCFMIGYRTGVQRALNAVKKC